MRQIQVFKYCLRCGNKAEAKDNHLVCSVCELHFYMNPKACTSVILQNRAGEYLLVKRAYEPKKGYWDFPGGFAEEDENFEECSRREVKEELGIEIQGLEYLSTHKDNYCYQDVDYKTIGVSYIAKFPENSKIVIADDAADYKFFNLEDIPIDELGFLSTQEMIEKLKERKK